MTGQVPPVPVVDLVTGTQYPSMSEASRVTGVGTNRISVQCSQNASLIRRGKNLVPSNPGVRHNGGYCWVRLEFIQGRTQDKPTVEVRP